MPGHDEYGKRVLWRASDSRVRLEGPTVEIDYGYGGRCRIDGTLDDSVAIEVEARTGKQVRGALLDLISHQFRKKLLVLLPGNMDVRIEVPRCRMILCRYFPAADVGVVALHGNGNTPCFDEDTSLVSRAICKLLLQQPEHKGQVVVR